MKKYSKKTILRGEMINKKGESPIVIRYTYDRKSTFISLGITIKPENWDEKESFPIQQKVSNFRELSRIINQKEDEIDTILNDYFKKNKFYPSTDVLKKLYNNEEVEDIKNQGELLILDYLKEYISALKNEEKMSPNTIKIFNSCRVHFEKFEKFQKSKFFIEDIDKELLIQYQTFLRKKDLQNSSINKYVKFFKIFINQYLIERKGLKINTSFQRIKSTSNKPKEKIDVLTEQEVENLKGMVYWEELIDPTTNTMTHYNLSDVEKQIGRMFLFQCYTGVAFADLLQLTYFDIHFPTLEKVKRIKKIYDELEQNEIEAENKEKKKIVEGCVIAFDRQKTENSCIVPLFGTAVELLIVQNMGLGGLDMSQVLYNESERISFLKSVIAKRERSIKNGQKRRQIFPSYTNQYYNREIKKLFQKLNLNKTIELKFDNVKKTRVIKSKWELITSHTARRTYISLNINKGIGIDTIMRTTGHNDFETLRIYIKQSQQSVYDEFQKVIEN
jgi:integrase